MRYIVLDESRNGYGDTFPQEFDNLTEAIKEAEKQWYYLDRAEQGCRKVTVFESANPDEKAENHFDGDIIWDCDKHVWDFDDVQDYILGTHHFAFDIDNYEAFLLGEAENAWDNAECDAEGLTPEQEEEHDSIVWNCVKELNDGPKIDYIVTFYDKETGALSEIDRVTEHIGYTADEYIWDCEHNSDSEWLDMIKSGRVRVRRI